MCGIAIGIGFENPNISSILSSISHRGPDSNGSFEENNIFLCHTRLSIQDLSNNGNQPMFSNDKRYVIVFNGEIYNHIEIRKRIEADFDFKSTSDTETLLYAYIKYGPSFLNLLNGIFSIGIYDRKEKELFIARDQLGVKPLYFYQDSKRLLFLSEIKTLVNLDVDKELNPKAIANYLTLLWSPGRETPFKKVEKILPGTYLKFKIDSNVRPKPSRYYQLEFNGRYFDKTEDELINELDKKLTNAVKRQMLSDVPVGFFLSGGLDSSLIVAIAKKLYPDKKFQCFTIDIDNWSTGSENFTNDLDYAKEVAELLDVELNIVKANIDIVKDFDKMIWHLDEPQADSAPLHVLNISSLAKEKGIKVLLGGTGGDDLFSGYRRHQALYYEKLINYIPIYIRNIIRSLLIIAPINNPYFRRIKKITNGFNKSSDERMAEYFNWLSYDKVKNLFNNKIINYLKSYSPSSFFIELNKEILNENNLLNKMLYWELRSFLVDHNLNYTDKMAMAVGVEARVPFLDLELVEFSLKIPPKLKMKGKETKYLLKKVAEKYLPKHIIYRSKTGFGAPVREWITQDMTNMIQERLSKKNLKQKNIFDHNEVWKLIDLNKRGKIDASYTIWAILALDSWLNQFNSRKS